MIISASRRTDIPCHYSEWFMNRIRAGYVITRNPMNPSQVSRIKLSPDTVDCIVFWTKDAAGIIPHLRELDACGYKYYFQFTLTPYGRDIERGLRDKGKISDTFKRLSDMTSPHRVVWRYDPVILNSGITAENHMEWFADMCSSLRDYTERVTVSFVDMYSKLKTDLVRVITEDEIALLSGFIGKTAMEYGLDAYACCEGHDLSRYGIRRAACIDKALIERICGCPLKLPPDKNQREGCGCAASVDIGAYNTCVNGCVYCYANNGDKAVKRRHGAHDPRSETLTGGIEDGIKVTEKAAESNKLR